MGKYHTYNEFVRELDNLCDKGEMTDGQMQSFLDEAKDSSAAEIQILAARLGIYIKLEDNKF